MKKVSKLVGIIGSVAFASTALLVSSLAMAAEDAALVSMVSGKVTYVSGKAAAKPLAAFSRVYEGDKITLPAGSTVKLNYLNAAKQETWQGPASLEAKPSGGKLISGVAPSVVQLPSTAPQKLAKIPELMNNSRVGGVLVRSAGASASDGKTPAAGNDTELVKAFADYEAMKAALPKDDITPELYLYSTLASFDMLKDLNGLVDTMKKKQPNAEGLDSLKKIPQ